MSFTFTKFLEELLHGSIAGLSMVLICHPADTLKTRRQLEPFKYKDMILRMIRKEGFLSFYKGVMSPTMSMPLFKSVIFSTYKMSLLKIQSEGWFAYNQDIQIGIAAFISGFVNSFVCGPKDLFKVKLQIQKGEKDRLYSGYMDILKKTYRISGPKNVFQGSFITVFREVSGYPVNFIYYERILRYFGRGDRNNTNYFHQFLAGGISGTMAWVVSFPFDIVKTRIQSYELNNSVKLFNRFQILREFRNVYRCSGLLGFYQGFSIFLMRSFLGNGMGYSIWNWCQYNLNFA